MRNFGGDTRIPFTTKSVDGRDLFPTPGGVNGGIRLGSLV